MQLELRKPLSEGYDRMKGLLFRPIRAETWFTLGFAAFLVALGEGGGFNIPGNVLPDSVTKSIAKGDAQSAFANIDWVGIIAGIVAVVLLFIVALAWISSRGTFVFLENLVTGRIEITSPWREFAPQANSLFAWRLTVGMVALLVSVPLLLGFASALLVRLIGIRARHIPDEILRYLPNSILVPSTELIVGLGVLLALWSFFFALLSLVMNDFVVPVMYRHRLSAFAAWRRAWPTVSDIPGSIILYGIFKLIVKFVIGLGIMLATFVTCFLLLFALVIPYISSVFTLPISVTFKYFNLYYLRQLGPDFDVFSAAVAKDPGLYVPPEERPSNPGDSENPYYPYKS
ncbi:MAG: hypothetical protein K8S54_20970 [Spirochaetia bacterium]|nr:hypothetical protein [Spirochaetia bacterium]